MTPGTSNHTRNGLIFVGVCAAFALAIYLGFRLIPEAGDMTQNAAAQAIENVTGPGMPVNELAAQMSPTANSAHSISVPEAEYAVERQCPGFWAYIPADRPDETAFTVQIEGGKMTFRGLDFSHETGRYVVLRDKVVAVEGKDGGRMMLDCRFREGTASFEVTEPSVNDGAAQSYELTQADGDIWSIAEARGWSVAEND
jgi:hypothetical protein